MSRDTRLLEALKREGFSLANGKLSHRAVGMRPRGGVRVIARGVGSPQAALDIVYARLNRFDRANLQAVVAEIMEGSES